MTKESNVPEEDLFADQAFFDNLEIDESVIEAKQNGGGEVVEASNDCGGACTI